MAPITIGAVAAQFGDDVGRAVDKVVTIIQAAAAGGVDLLVFPDACLGGYIRDQRTPDPGDPPPALDSDGPEMGAVMAAAGAMTVCVGYAEAASGGHYNSAICVCGDGVLGTHRKVHQPAGESLAYLAGTSFNAFDTPVGKLGMLIDDVKMFPESARILALDGAHIIAALSAWPANVTDRASRLAADPQSRLFDLYESAWVAENQVVVVSSKQNGIMGDLHLLGHAEVVGRGGYILATIRSKGGLAKVTIDVEAEIVCARVVLNHLGELLTGIYRLEPRPTGNERRTEVTASISAGLSDSTGLW